MSLPNLVAYERALLHALSAGGASKDNEDSQQGARGAGAVLDDRCPSDAARSRPVVGLVAALDCRGALPFWTTLLDGLGFPVMISHPTPEDAVWASQWLAPPSPEVCVPAKAVHYHAANLIRRQADVVLMLAFERGNHCPTACGYGTALADVWEGAKESGLRIPPLVVPRFHLAKPHAIARHESTAASLRWLVDALHVASRNPAAPVYVMEQPMAEDPLEASSDACFHRALSRALQQQERFSRIMQNETAEALAWLYADPTRKAVLLAGRPYHLDAFAGTSPDKAAVDAGFAVLSLSGLGTSARGAEKRRRGAEPTHSWKQGKHLVRAALVAAADPQIELVCLQSFGCGFDALSIEAARDALTAAGKSLLVLPMDDGPGVAAQRVRLRTLAAAHGTCGRAGALSPAQTRDAGRGGSAPSDNDPRPDLAVNDLGMADSKLDAVGHNAGRRLPDGLCAIVKHFVAGRSDAGWPSSNDNDRVPSSHSDTFALPDLCSACLTEGVPYLRGVDSDTPVSFLDFNDEYERRTSSALTRALEKSAQLASGAPLLGVIGNPLLIADKYLNDNLFAEIVRAGVRPVLPRFTLLRGEDISYPDQLETFYSQGVRHVVYLMPQGCLKGHTQVRGALHSLRARFPELRLTVIDYDPEGSSANRRNRLALAIAQTRHSTIS